MNLWSDSRIELQDLPGIHPQTDGSIDFSFSDDEQCAVDSFFKLLEDYRFYPEIAESQLDQLFLSWLENSFPNVPSYRKA